MASLLPSLAIVAVEPDGLPTEFASHYAPPRLRSRSHRSLSGKHGSRRRLRLHSDVSHQRRPKIILVESQGKHKQGGDKQKAEKDNVLAKVEEERVSPPSIDPPSTKRHAAVSPTRTSSRRGFFRKSSSTSNSGRFRLFTGGRKTSAEKVITHRKKNPSDGVSEAPLQGQHSPSYNSQTKGQGSPSLLLGKDDIMVDDVVRFPKGDDVSRGRMSRMSSLSGSLATRSVSGRSYGTSASRRSKRSSTARLIRPPILKNNFSEEVVEENDLSEEVVVDDDDATQEISSSNTDEDDDNESQQDEEVNWLAGDRTTISSVGGGGRSQAGVDSIIGDPTEVCGMLQDVMYRDFRNFLSGLANPGQIGYRQFPGNDSGPAVEFTRSNDDATSADGYSLGTIESS